MKTPQSFKTVFVFGILLLGIVLPFIGHAQGPTDPFPGGGDPDVYVPLDGGLSVIVAACIGYGIKERKKKVFQEEVK